MDVDNLISDSSAISKSSLYICKFSVHVLLKPRLKNCGLVCGQSWRIVHIHLRRMCILLLLEGMLYKYQLILSGLMCHLRPEFPYWYFVCSNCPLIEMGIKLSHYYHAAVNFSSWLLVFALYVGVLLCWAHIYLKLLYLLGLIFDHYVVSFFVSCSSLYCKVYCIWVLLLQLSFDFHLHGVSFSTSLLPVCTQL